MARTGQAGQVYVGSNLRAVTTPYLYQIAERVFPDHDPWRVLGYNADVDAAMEDVWPVGGAYVVPTAAMQMEAVSSSAGDEDAGTVIKSGTSDTITVSGTTLTLTDAAVDFTAATAVAAGDCLLLDGDVCHGIVLTVAANVLTAGYCDDVEPTSAQAYRIVDHSLPAASTGVKVVHLDCLDADYAEHEEFVVLNGNTAVATAATNLLRVNLIHTVFAGSLKAAVGTIDVRHVADTPIYRRMDIGRNRSDTAFYTIPDGKTGYITSWMIGEGFSTVNRYVEAHLRTTTDDHGHLVDGIFFGKGFAIVQDNTIVVRFDVPIKVAGRSDVKVSASCPETNAIVVTNWEGWIE